MHGYCLFLLRWPVLLSHCLGVKTAIVTKCSFVCGLMGCYAEWPDDWRGHVHNVVLPRPPLSLSSHSQPIISPGPCTTSHIIPGLIINMSRCLCRGIKGVLLQIRRGEGVFGDAGSRYQEVEVRRRRVRSAVLSLDAPCSSMPFRDTAKLP